MTDVIRYFGKEKFDPVHIREIYPAFERFEVERFRCIVKIVFRDCTFPPRLAEFIKASETLRKEDAIPRPTQVKELEFEPFFPSKEWIEAQMPVATDGLKNPRADEIREVMLRMAGAMRANHQGMQRMMRGK